ASNAGASANDDAPQAHSAAQPAASAEPATIAGDHGGAAPSNVAESDPGARSLVAPTDGHASSQGDVVAGQEPRTSEGIPAAGIGSSSTDPVTAHTGLAPSAQASPASPAADLGRIGDAGAGSPGAPSGAPSLARTATEAPSSIAAGS